MDNPLLIIAGVLVLVSMLSSTLRLVVGPSTPDRAVALDSLTIMGVSLIALFGVITARAIYLDVALVYALVSFLGIVAIARYLERGL